MHYTIEGGLDFFTELSAHLKTDTGDKFDAPCCLISGEPLEHIHVTLECKHSFNYSHIFNETINQKKRGRFKTNEMMCPYCRHIQPHILPFRNISKCDSKIHGVNYPAKYCMKTAECKYIFKRGVNKGKFCGKNCELDFCKLHNK